LRDKIKLHLIGFIYINIIFIVLILLSFDYADEFKISLLQYILFVVTLFVLYSASQIIKIYNIYFIFICMNILFLYNRIFLDMFDLYDFSITHFPIIEYFSINTQEELIIVFIQSLIILHIGFLFSISNNSSFENLKYNQLLYRIGYILFSISIPPLLYKVYIKFHIVSEYGYTSLYTIAKDYSYPWFTQGAESIFLLGFSLLVASYPSIKKIKVIIIIYLIIGLILAVNGTRGLFIVKIVYVFWLYYTFYSAKTFKFRNIFIIIVSVILFSQYMGAQRSTSQFDTKKIFTHFFEQQGTSMTVLGFMIENKDAFIRNGYPYILHPLVATFIPNQGQNQKYVENYNSLSPDLTYFLNSEAYLNGEGLSSSYIAELYDLGYILMFIFLFVLGLFIGKVENYIMKNRIFLFLSPLIISQIIYMPRTHMFPRFREVIFYIIIFLIIHIINKKYKKRLL
jgi:oligosaccharide repeat unit polymerase